MFIKNKKDTDYTDTVIHTYDQLKGKYQHYEVRISDLMSILMFIYGINELEFINDTDKSNNEINSYLMDEQIKWIKGEDVDFDLIYENLLEHFDFSTPEKNLFSLGKIEERLWAIYLFICNPELDDKI